MSLLGLAAVTAGCGEDDEAREAAIARAKKGKAGAPTSAPPPPDPATRAPTPIFKFTEKPDITKAPDGPVQASRDGEPMAIRSLVFEPRGERWTLTFHDVALPRPTGLVRGSLPLVLELPAVPAVGARIAKPFGEGGALWRVPGKAAAPPVVAASAPASAASDDGKRRKTQAPASAPAAGPPPPPIDWRAPNAFVVEITDWKVAPYADDGPAFQAGGTASGRVVVVFKGQGNRVDSWVAGHFTDAVVRYMGRPDPKVASIVAHGPKAMAPDGGPPDGATTDGATPDGAPTPGPAAAP